MGDRSHLGVRKANEADVREFAQWRHEPPYDIYNITQTPESAVQYFLADATNCHVIVRDQELVGFATFGSDAQVPGGDYSSEALDIGLGIKPELTGKGQGAEYVATVIDFAHEALDRPRMRVTVAIGNTRATVVWLRNGFTEVDRFESTGPEVMGSRTFVVLESAATA